MTTVLVPLANGCEEIEAVTVIDLLRRAGVTVVVAGLAAGPVRASRGTVLVPDTTLDQVMNDAFDMVVLPGGQPGTNNLNADARIHAILQRVYAGGKIVAAICAAPKVLATAGLLDGKRVTSFPGALDLVAIPGMIYIDTPVIKDGRVITSRGPGVAMEFALVLIEVLLGAQKRAEVDNGLLRQK